MWLLPLEQALNAILMFHLPIAEFASAYGTLAKIENMPGQNKQSQ